MGEIRINHLKYLAMKYADKLVLNEDDEEKRKNTDLTEIFYKTLYLMVKNKDLINITINGQVRNGKSTVGLALGQYVNNEILIKLEKTNMFFGMYHVARDQLEGSKKQRDKERNNTVLVIDEWNEGEEGGENSTAERSLNSVLSDIHAGRYIHKFNISPKYIHDKNSDVVLEVIGKNTETKTTMCYLYYKLYQGGRETQELLGYVNVYVGDLIKNWLKIEERFLQEQRKETISEEIIEIGRKDFYVEYMIKKYQKMDLITKEGILQPRMLDYAEIVLNIVSAMKVLARSKSGITQGLIRTNVKAEFRKRKLPLTVFGQALIMEEIQGILQLYKAQTMIRKDLSYLDNKKQLTEWNIEEKKLLLDQLNETGVLLNTTLEDYRKMVRINEEYHERL